MNTNAVCYGSSVGLVWDFGLNLLVSLNPDDLKVADKATGLYPFMLVAASSIHSNADLDTIFQVIMTCPHIVDSSRGSRN